MRGRSSKGERGTVYRLDGVRVERVAIDGAVVLAEAVPTAAAGRCPACEQPSARVRPTDRRFRCGTPGCARRTFAEQVPGVTGPHRQAVWRLETLVGVWTCFGLTDHRDSGRRRHQ